LASAVPENVAKANVIIIIVDFMIFLSSRKARTARIARLVVASLNPKTLQSPRILAQV
jgi:hypothetical protein